MADLPTVLFSSGGIISLSRRCRHRCAYCLFRSSNEGYTILPLRDLEEELVSTARKGITEITFECGEAPQEFPEVQLSLRQQNCSVFGEYLTRVTALALRHQLLPIFSLGDCSPIEAQRLAESGAIFKIWVTPAELGGKGEAHENAHGRGPSTARNLVRMSHEAQLPYHLRFLVGIGETPEQRIQTISDFGRYCAADPFLQDVGLQPFQPQPGTPFHARPPLAFEAIHAAMKSLMKAFPVHQRSIPPHLFSRFAELLDAGLNDLGSMPLNARDPSHLSFPIPPLADIQLRLARKNHALRERLCLTTIAGWQRPKIMDVYQHHHARLAPKGSGKNLNLIDDRHCFVCGSENQNGLRLAFRFPDSKTCSATWVSEPRFQGYAGMVHGGILTSLLDEVMAHALIHQGLRIVTAGMSIRFQRPGPVGEALTFVARHSRSRRRIHYAEATACLADGTVIATAEGRYAEP